MSIEQISPETLKFNSCKHRSSEEIEKLIRRCNCQGGNYIAKGYYCNTRDIFQLTAEMCKDCPVYEVK
jgi:hypothetical protein